MKKTGGRKSHDTLPLKHRRQSDKTEETNCKAEKRQFVRKKHQTAFVHFYFLGSKMLIDFSLAFESQLVSFGSELAK